LTVGSQAYGALAVLEIANRWDSRGGRSHDREHDRVAAHSAENGLLVMETLLGRGEEPQLLGFPALDRLTGANEDERRSNSEQFGFQRGKGIHVIVDNGLAGR
jgi:hypothetical protein